MGLPYTIKNADFNPSGFEGVNLEIFLPEEDPDNKYVFKPIYNVSKSWFFKDFNALLIVMRKEKTNDAITDSTEETHILSIKYDEITPYPKSVTFDPDARKILFLVYHDDGPTVTDTNYIFENVKEFFEKVEANGPDTIELPKSLLPKPKGTHAKPRRVGMSVISRNA
jgi:hypothetical protein